MCEHQARHGERHGTGGHGRGTGVHDGQHGPRQQVRQRVPGQGRGHHRERGQRDPGHRHLPQRRAARPRQGQRGLQPVGQQPHAQHDHAERDREQAAEQQVHHGLRGRQRDLEGAQQIGQPGDDAVDDAARPLDVHLPFELGERGFDVRHAQRARGPPVEGEDPAVGQGAFAVGQRGQAVVRHQRRGVQFLRRVQRYDPGDVQDVGVVSPGAVGRVSGLEDSDDLGGGVHAPAEHHGPADAQPHPGHRLLHDAHLDDGDRGAHVLHGERLAGRAAAHPLHPPVGVGQPAEVGEGTDPARAGDGRTGGLGADVAAGPDHGPQRRRDEPAPAQAGVLELRA